MAGTDYTQDVVDALEQHYGKVFFAAARNETEDGVFQIVNEVACPVADVNVITGDVRVLTDRDTSWSHNVATPDGLEELVEAGATWATRDA